MNLQFASINSGSNGNCYYIGNGTQGILIDVGISAKVVVDRLNSLGVSMDSIQGIFVSHEHSDHIKGLDVLCKRYQIPVYFSNRTYQNSRVLSSYREIMFFKHGDRIQIADFEVYCFNKIHDAVDPFSFSISYKDKTVGVFTDIGAVCSELKEQFRKCDVVFLESNYDQDMLINSQYPYHLKNRIMGGRGHLSNAQALQLFISERSPRLAYLFLSHLSKNNNCPKLALELFQPYAGNTHVEVASRDCCSNLFLLEDNKSVEEISSKLEMWKYQIELF